MVIHIRSSNNYIRFAVTQVDGAIPTIEL